MIDDRLVVYVIEKKVKQTLGALASDIAKQLCTQRGKVVIVCDHPSTLMPMVKKQWLRLTRCLQSERSKTLDAKKIHALVQEIAWMQTRKFSAKPDPELLEISTVDILFATTGDLLQYAPVCKALYVTCEIKRIHLYSITAWMPPDSLVVMYTLPRQSLKPAQQNKHSHGQQQLQ